jgi:hypothetical protein
VKGHIVQERFLAWRERVTAERVGMHPWVRDRHAFLGRTLHLLMSILHLQVEVIH